jgi:magnesium transporter
MHALEEQALQPRAADDTLLELTQLRHDFLGVRRAVWPMREEIAVLQREESTLISPETRVFLRDVYDHTIQALEIVESLREMAVAVTEVFLSAQNQRLNQVMKVLTVISTLFIPLTFIASIYGMNFKYMPELDRPWAYPIVLSVMAATAAGMLVFFKKQGWW